MAVGRPIRHWAVLVLLTAGAALAACSDDGDGGTAPLQCPDGQILCGDRCSDTNTDPLNCGSCGEACGGGEVCNMGGCDTSCGADLTDCNGSCRDLTTDPNNCGTCGTACAMGEVCADSSCSFNCPATQTACGGLCVTLDNDRNNCGACGNACGADEVCNASNCERFCPSGLLECDGQCRDVTSDRNHCGACGVACGPDEQCVNSACTLTCDGGAPDECNGACTNVLTDPANCGACGTACGVGEVCSMGNCEIQCAPGLAQCGQTCTSTLTDPANCGACDSVCTTTASAAVSVCIDGGCNLACRAGFDDCDNDLVLSGGNGCEIDLTADVNNCASCGNVCTFPNGAAACISAQCELAACDMGFDDCNMMQGDGCESELASDAANCGACGNVCGALESCQSSACVFTPGENCASAIPLMTGTSTYAWVASNVDYLVSARCLTFGALEGPDVLFTYTSTINGYLNIDFEKPANNRYVFVASEQACGTIAPGDQRTCVSNFGPSTMSGSVRIMPSMDYTVYFRDTTSGAASLPNPITLTVSTLNCANQATVSVTALSPVSGSTTTELNPAFSATFDGAVDTSTGTITITGDQGTRLTYDLSTSPSEVSFNGAGTVLTVNPGINFPPGENLTITLTGLSDALCNNPIMGPTWQVEIITPPCAPGLAGMVGSTVQRISTGITVGTEYYVAADTSTAGYVYVGGLTDLQRVPKAGGTVEDIDTAAGLTAANLGYEMLVDGNDIYTVNNSGGPTGRIFRISSNGGSTWSVLDAVTFPSNPTDDFRAAEAYGGRIYLMTHEGSAFQDTQIWSFPAGVATATVATLEGAISGETNCSGLAVDDTYFYAACGGGERLIRQHRLLGTVTLLTTRWNLSSTNNSMYGVDLDSDGTTDILYLQTWFEEGFFVCEPDSATPFFGDHFTFGGANANYGMGYDQATRLYSFDDDTDDVIVIE